MLILVSITQTAIGFLRGWLILILSQKINIPIVLNYFKHIYDLPIKFFSTRKTGDIMTRFSDALVIKNIVTNIAMSLILDIGMAVISGVVLYYMNSQLFIIIIGLTICNIGLVFVFKKPYKTINEEQMQKNSALSSRLIEGLRSVETIKINAYEKFEMEAIEQNFIQLLHIQYREGMISNIQGLISSVVSILGNLLILYVGMKKIMDGDMTLGLMMSFNTISSMFMGERFFSTASIISPKCCF